MVITSLSRRRLGKNHQDLTDVTKNLIRISQPLSLTCLYGKRLGLCSSVDFGLDTPMHNKTPTSITLHVWSAWGVTERVSDYRFAFVCKRLGLL